MEGTSVVRHARRLLLALVTLLCAPHPAWSWGNDGHHVVGTMADLLLEQHPTTHDKVRTILGGASLAEATVWADCAKGFVHCQRDPTPEEKAFTQRNPRHRSFHYTNVPVQQPEYRAGTAGTASDDIVQVLEHAVSVLRGQAPASGPAVLDQQEALWLIAHLNRVYFEKRSFSSSGSRRFLTQRRSAMMKGSRFRRTSKSATRRVRSSALAWQW
jgi:hypothetical protein